MNRSERAIIPLRAHILNWMGLHISPMRWSMLFVFWALASGCGSKDYARSRIQSDSARQRILAIRAAVDAHDHQAIPLIVDRLEDQDEGVRFFAILALEKLTGQRLGYVYSQPAEKRDRAVEKWRDAIRNDLQDFQNDRGAETVTREKDDHTIAGRLHPAFAAD